MDTMLSQCAQAADPGDVDAALQFTSDVLGWNQDGVRTFGPEERGVLAGLAARAVSRVRPKPAPADPADLQPIREHGYTVLRRGLTRAEAAETAAFFAARPCFNCHCYPGAPNDGVPRRLDEGARRFAFGSYPQADLCDAPHLLDLFVSDPVLALVADYLGAAPTIFSVNAWWSFGRDGAPGLGQDYHRDMSHPKFVVLFVYLTEVTGDTGAHQYIRGTHRPDLMDGLVAGNRHGLTGSEMFRLPNDGLGFSALYEEVFGTRIDTVVGPPGTAFLADTYGLHRGLTPRTGDRLAAWARYAALPVAPSGPRIPASRMAGRPFRDNALARYALRALVEA